MRLVGLDLIGAVIVIGAEESKWVHSVNTAAFRANMMAGDTPGDVFNDDPAFLMQPGQEVKALGPAVAANNKVMYVPCSIATHDGVFWVRASSLGGPLSKAVAEDKPSWWSGVAWAGGPTRWQVALAVLAGGGLLGLTAWGFSGPKPRQMHA